MYRIVRPFLASLMAAFLVSRSLSFQSPLSEQSIREAYFLGQRNDETTASFFTSYVRGFDRPETGPVVSEVEIYTPFVQLVEASRLRTSGYSVQQAADDYHRLTDTIFVRVRIEFTPTYGTPQFFLTLPPDAGRSGSAPQRADFYHDFRIGLSQNGQWIEPLSLRNDLTNTTPHGHLSFDPDGVNSWIHYGRGGGSFGVTGWLVWLAFDAKDVGSDEAAIEISGPNDQTWTAKYDLGKLR